MATHLYCLLAAPAADATAGVPRGLLGVGGAPVRALAAPASPHGRPAGGSVVELWVSDAGPPLPAEVTQEVALAAMAHDAVVTAALATGRTPLPARFGQRFADDAACVAGVTERAAALAPLFARVAGMVEMTVVVAPSTRRMVRELLATDARDASPPAPRPDPSQPRAGRRYLETLRDRARDAERARVLRDAAADRVSAAVWALVRDEVRRHQPARGVVSLSHLVPRDAAAAYRSAVDAVRPAPGLRHLVAGPRAPYSFAAVPGMDLAG